MKNFLSKPILRIGIALLAPFFLTGCDSMIYDEQGDCEPVHIIRFKYDKNMKFADAFSSEVSSVDLHVFNKDGKLVTSVSRFVSPEEAEDFSIELRGLEKDHYTLLAWCGVKGSEHFTINPNSEPIPEIQHHQCFIKREVRRENGEEGDIREDIGRLYHCRLDNVDFTQDEGTHYHMMPLIKDTNVIRVVLQHLSGKPMDKDDYKITITDANGYYDHNNDLLPDMTLTYHPWSLRSGTATFHPEDQPQDSRAQTSVSAVVSEHTVGRLMADRNEEAILTVRNSHTGDLILSIPLIDYLLLVKGYYYTPQGMKPMSDQEYLDRQDEYPMTFFLDDDDEWIKSVIYINSWRLVFQDSPIH